MCLELEITLEALYSIINTKFKTSLMTILIYIRLLCISNILWNGLFYEKDKKKKTPQFSVEMIFLIVNFIF